MKLGWNETWINNILDVARQAGAVLLKYSESRGEKVVFKEDDSPVTLADHESNRVLVEGLRAYFPDLPIISEEIELPDFRIRSQYKRYWLIDPLDGTKEYVKGLKESCVCIALIESGEVVFSVVEAPYWETTFLAIRGKGAREWPYGETTPGPLLTLPKIGDEVRIFQSRSKPVVEGQFLENLPVKWIPMGSALKFCALARGDAHVYFRWSPFREWDAAAGHLVAEEAGARVTGLDGASLRYNNEDLLLKGIVCTPPRFSVEQLLDLKK